jgi:hypothetical protein
MSPTIDHGIAHYDTNDPVDLAVLISSGMIWKGGPKTIAMAIKALQSGAVPRPANLPPAVAAFLDGTRAAQTAPSAATDDGATEPSVVDGWQCPEHGSDSLVALESNRGRRYRACTQCERFET